MFLKVEKLEKDSITCLNISSAEIFIFELSFILKLLNRNKIKKGEIFFHPLL